MKIDLKKIEKELKQKNINKRHSGATPTHKIKNIAPMEIQDKKIAGHRNIFRIFLQPGCLVETQ